MNKRKFLLALMVIIAFTFVFIYFYYNALTIKLIGNEKLTIALGENYVELGAKATYLYKDFSSNIETKGDVDTSKVGTYSVEYNITKGKITRSVVRKIIVVDLTSPEIVLNGAQNVILCGKEYVEDGYQAIDNVDGDVTDRVEIVKEENKIIYSVIDSSGNKTEITRNLINDNVNPEISLIHSDNLTFKKGKKYKEFGAKAIDNCDGDITSRIEIVSNVDVNKVGDYVVTYKVKDSSDNESIITRNIKVYNKEELNKGYTEIEQGPKYVNGILIVSKKYAIPSDFKADNAEALKALSDLQAAAKKAGYSLPTRSAYRSYSTQASLYERYKKSYGQEYTDGRAARPGHSEHQTGLAFDIGIATVSFGSTKAGIWLNNNCAKYGFIIRYPEYKEAITGYNYEPWHVRYVGVDIATEIMDKKITLEEYLGLYTDNNL